MKEIEYFFNFIFDEDLAYEIRLLPKKDNSIPYDEIREFLRDNFEKNEYIFNKNSIYLANKKDYPLVCETLGRHMNVYLAVQPKRILDVIKTKENGKKTCRKIKHLALDIDAKVDGKVISDDAKDTLFFQIKKTLSQFKITNYMIINSGNGFHVWIKLRKPIELSADNFDVSEKLYKELLNRINSRLKQNTLNKFEIDTNARDISRILRVPGTKNLKQPVKEVRLLEISKDDSIYFDSYVDYVADSMKTTIEKKHVKTTTQIDEDDDFMNEPLVELWLEDDLPDNSNKHSTIGFAIQGLVQYYGMSNTTEVNELQHDINLIHSNSLNLNYCTKSDIDIVEIYKITYVWVKQYYSKYEDKVKRRLDSLQKKSS